MNEGSQEPDPARSQFHDATKFAVQSAFAELLDLIATVGEGRDEAEVEELCREAERISLAMMAVIVLADGSLGAEEATFLTSLLNVQETPGGVVRYVNEYAARWPTLSATIPGFFKLAVQRDRLHGTQHARAVLRHIQLIGNNICIADRDFATGENRIVREYVAFLEAALDQPSATEGDLHGPE